MTTESLSREIISNIDFFLFENRRLQQDKPTNEKVRESTCSYWDMLPSDLHSDIIQCLSFRKIHQIRSCSKAIGEIANTIILKKIVDPAFSEKEDLVQAIIGHLKCEKSLLLKALLESCRNQYKTQINVMELLKDKNEMMHFLESLPETLETLAICLSVAEKKSSSHCSLVDSTALAWIAQRFQQVRACVLVGEGPCITKEGIDALHPLLKQLNAVMLKFDWKSTIQKEGLCQLGSYLKQLEILWISEDFIKGEGEGLAILSGHLEQVKTLLISCSELNDALVEALKLDLWPHLESLHFQYFCKMDIQNFERIIEKGKHLKEICFTEPKKCETASFLGTCIKAYPKVKFTLILKGKAIELVVPKKRARGAFDLMPYQEKRPKQQDRQDD